MAGALGRRTPEDWTHVERYPYAALRPQIVSEVNKILKLPSWHWSHDQGAEGSCVGHAGVMERAITNLAQNRLASLFSPGRRYDPLWAWDQAKIIDPFPDTNPGDDNGTLVSSFYDVARDQGMRRIAADGISINPVTGKPVVTDPKESQPDLKEGVLTTRWATSVDEIRTAIAQRTPVTIGIDWYDNFDEPQVRYTRAGREDWIGQSLSHLGSVRGGHAVCLFGASDTRQAFRLKNSWGRDYPLVWLPYTTMQKLLNDDGEAALITDR